MISAEELEKHFAGVGKFLEDKTFAEVWPKAFRSQVKALARELKEMVLATSLMGKNCQVIRSAMCTVGIFNRLLEKEIVSDETLVQLIQEFYKEANDEDLQRTATINKLAELLKGL